MRGPCAPPFASNLGGRAPRPPRNGSGTPQRHGDGQARHGFAPYSTTRQAPGRSTVPGYSSIRTPPCSRERRAASITAMTSTISSPEIGI